ncbi:hypothetical protein, partial [Streptomyces sp. 13-12-16]|uniref:hypothetical protein n=1 Tax=Streptomyces sp. 13-12-16 TaxID=1570823 RepID=UPI001C4FE91C
RVPGLSRTGPNRDTAALGAGAESEKTWRLIGVVPAAKRQGVVAQAARRTSKSFGHLAEMTDHPVPDGVTGGTQGTGRLIPREASHDG